MAMLELDGIVTCDVALLTDCDRLRAWLPEMVRRIGMKPVGEVIVQPYAHWEGTAPSAVLFMEESAVVVHTYPQANYLEITLHSCNAIPEPDIIIAEITQLLGMIVRFVRHTPERNWRELSAKQ